MSQWVYQAFSRGDGALPPGGSGRNPFEGRTLRPACARAPAIAIRGAARPPAGGAPDADPGQTAGSSPVRATRAYQRALDFGTRACVG
ncbi:hypothetical protein GCM10022420_057520 [Streptomyces iranensis]